jgi:biopolymer transport protein ExbB
MRRYATSKFRVLLFIAMIAAVAFIGRTSMAADDAASGATKTPAQGVGSLIMENRDFVFFTILGLSVWGVTLIIQGFLKNRAAVFMPEGTTDQIRNMINERRFKELIDFTETDPSFISKALNPALKRAPSFSSMKEAMETAIGEQTAEQFRKIEYLNIIGNLGPLLGLLGTVLGMIDAFQGLKASGGQANPADLAGGISKALTHTMLGLMLAVPCLAAFGVLRTIVDRLTVRGALVAEDLLLMIKPADAKPGLAPAAAPRVGAVPQPATPVTGTAPVRKAPFPAPQ